MSVAKVIEVIASSKVSFEAAVQEGVSRVTDSVTQVTAAWVKDQNVVVENGKITEYRVVLKVTFIVKETAKATKSKSSKK